MSNGNKPLFARSGTSNPLGKCTAELKTRVPEEIEQEFVIYATLRGQTTAEVLRDMVIEKMRGATYVMTSIVQRDVVIGRSGKGPE